MTRTITTPEELDALPLASIVMTFDGLAWQATSEIDGDKLWINTQDGHDFPVFSIGMHYDSITVLHEPGRTEPDRTFEIPGILIAGEPGNEVLSYQGRQWVPHEERVLTAEIINANIAGMLSLMGDEFDNATEDEQNTIRRDPALWLWTRAEQITNEIQSRSELAATGE